MRAGKRDKQGGELAELGPSTTWHQVGGYTGVATAIAAWYTALADVMRSTFKRQVLPVFPI